MNRHVQYVISASIHSRQKEGRSLATYVIDDRFLPDHANLNSLWIEKIGRKWPDLIRARSLGELWRYMRCWRARHW